MFVCSSPSCRIPHRSTMQPVRKQSSTAMSGLVSCVYVCVSSDNSAVGPMLTSLQVPNTMYTTEPAKAEYRPYCKQTSLHFHLPVYSGTSVPVNYQPQRANYNAIIPWIRVLNKLVVVQLVKKFPTYFGTLTSFTMFTRACYWNISRAISVQSTFSRSEDDSLLGYSAV
jgi:hypothetical protein